MTMTIAKLDEMIRSMSPSYGVYFHTMTDVRIVFREAVNQFGDQVAAELWDRAEKVSRTTPFSMATALRNEIDTARLLRTKPPALLAEQKERLARNEYVMGVDMAAEPVVSKAAPSGIANLKIDRATRVYSNGEDPEKIVVEGHAHENGHMVNKTFEIERQFEHPRSRCGLNADDFRIVQDDGSPRPLTMKERADLIYGSLNRQVPPPAPKAQVSGTVTLIIKDPKELRRLMGLSDHTEPAEQDRAVHGAIAAMTSAQANRRPNEL